MSAKKIVNNLKKIIKNHYYFKSDSYWRKYIYKEINMLAYYEDLNSEFCKKLFNDALNKAVETLEIYIHIVTPWDYLKDVKEEEARLLRNEFNKVWVLRN